jgi:hypothetical protein
MRIWFVLLQDSSTSSKEKINDIKEAKHQSDGWKSCTYILGWQTYQISFPKVIQKKGIEQ